MSQTTDTEQLLHERMAKLGIDELPPGLESLPPTQDELPYDDGEPMESPWHASNGSLLKASYVALRGGKMDTFFVGVNMFLYYSTEQVRTRDYKGPDFFIVKDVDGTRHRFSWVVWEEDARYPDVIVEFLSRSTEREDLGSKKQLYEHIFRTPEYFCVAPNVERLYGWRLKDGAYVAIEPNERGWLWSEELELWLGPWQGTYLGEEWVWLRFFHPEGNLVLTSDEIAQQQAEAAQQQAAAALQQAAAALQQAEAALQQAAIERARSDELAARLAALEAELNRLRGTTTSEA